MYRSERKYPLKKTDCISIYFSNLRLNLPCRSHSACLCVGAERKKKLHLKCLRMKITLQQKYVNNFSRRPRAHDICQHLQVMFPATSQKFAQLCL